MSTLQTARPLTQIRAAQTLMQHRRSEGWTALNDVFRAGGPPKQLLDGFYSGALIALDIFPGFTQFAKWVTSGWMPWKGKEFDAAHSAGDNRFENNFFLPAHVFWPFYHGYRQKTRSNFQAFRFQTYVGPGIADHDRQVLKLNYALDGNPGLNVRRVVDELVQVDDGLFLGKAFFRWPWWGQWQLLAYFTVAKSNS